MTTDGYYVEATDPGPFALVPLAVRRLAVPRRSLLRRGGEPMTAKSGASVTLPLAAVLAHWRSGWFDMPWNESVARVWAKEPERMAALSASVQEVGIREPVVLGSDGRVWDGHHRLAVACRLGLRTVPVTFAALANLDSGCPTCGLPVAVHALWCPSRPTVAETADGVLRRVHAVFNDPSRAWFAEQFWTAYADQPTPEAGESRG